MPRIWTSIKGPNNKKWKIRELPIDALLDCLRQDYHGTRTDTDGGGSDGGSSNKGNVRGRLIKDMPKSENCSRQESPIMTGQCLA